MNRFVANLLDMARLESGILKPNREWCDISDIVGVALKEVRDMLPEDRLSIEVPAEVPLIRVDFSLIEQVLINLLENAAKYSPPASNISMTVSIAQGELRVEIGDCGLPIPAGDRLQVFDKFYRLHSSKHDDGNRFGSFNLQGYYRSSWWEDMGRAGTPDRKWKSIYFFASSRKRSAEERSY